MLNELPELEDLEAVGEPMEYMQRDQRYQGQLQPEKYQKFIRAQHRMNTNSGMIEPENRQERYAPPERAVQEHFIPPPPTLNCIDVAGHVQGCPICSKFYGNDRTLYIIAIVVLAIIAILLLKRVLNV